MANSSSTDSNSILVINTPTYYIKFSVNQLGENNSCVKVEKISVRKKHNFIIHVVNKLACFPIK